MKKNLSIILPVYNENESLELMVKILTHSLEFEHEIIVVYDSLDDQSVPMAKKLENDFNSVKSIHNKIAHGVKYAIQSGLSIAKFDVVLISAVDEIFPILEINKMLEKMINENYDLISGTRYKLGGQRLGGSLVGRILSVLANYSFKIITNFPLSDSTTGIKMIKKDCLNKINLTFNPVGWSCAFEISIRAYLQNFKIGEVPLKSVDRLFGGSSTFNPGSWIVEYFKLYIWGVFEIYKKKIKKKYKFFILL